MKVRGEKTRPPRRMFWLLAALIALFLIYPVTARWGVPGARVFNGLLAGLLLVTLYVIGRRAKFFRPAAVAFVLLMAAALLNAVFLQAHLLSSLTSLGWFVFYVYTVATLLGRVLRSDRVTLEEISGAVSVYILLGLLFANVYGAIYRIAPDSFYISSAYAVEATEPGAYAGHGVFFLFSFATLTTLGYGDITPASPFTRSLAILEAITGVVYIAVLVASLVAIGTHHRLSRKQDPGS